MAAGGAVEAGVAEGEDASVGADQPVAATGRASPPCPRSGLFRAMLARGAAEVRVPKAKMPAVGGHEPVATDVGGGRHAHHGLFKVVPPIEPWKTASPKLKTPPSEATVQ